MEFTQQRRAELQKRDKDQLSTWESSQQQIALCLSSLRYSLAKITFSDANGAHENPDKIKATFKKQPNIRLFLLFLHWIKVFLLCAFRRIPITFQSSYLSAIS